MQISDIPVQAGARPQLRDVAIQLESQFLAELYRSAGLEKALAGNDDGDPFASMLVDVLAAKQVSQRGFGLAEIIMQKLSAQADAP